MGLRTLIRYHAYYHPKPQFNIVKSYSGTDYFNKYRELLPKDEIF